MIEFLSDMASVAVDWRWWLLFGWLPLAVVGAPLLAGWLYTKRKDRERMQQEALASTWARQHGGDPEYRGGMKRPRVEVVQSGGEFRAHLVERAQ